MSIYPVRIKKFFPPVMKNGASDEEIKMNKDHRDIIKMVLSFRWTVCETCGNRVKMRNGWVYHAMPFGYSSKAWCSIYCLNK